LGLLNTLTENGSKFYVAHRPLSGVINSPTNIDPVTKRFRVKVELRVRDLDSLIPISLQLGNANHWVSEGRNISASPFTLNGLLGAQGWESPFGRADHGPTEPDDITELTGEGRRASNATKRPFKEQISGTSKKRRF
jgi:hypothetical protein